MQRFGNLWGLSLVKTAEGDPMTTYSGTGGSVYNPQVYAHPQMEGGLGLPGAVPWGAGLGTGLGVNNLWNRFTDPNYIPDLRSAKGDYRQTRYYNRVAKRDPDSLLESVKKSLTRKPSVRFNKRILTGDHPRASDYLSVSGYSRASGSSLDSPLDRILRYRQSKVQDMLERARANAKALETMEIIDPTDFQKVDKLQAREARRIKLLEQQAAKFKRLQQPARGPYMNVLHNRFKSRGGIFAGALAGLGVAKTLSDLNRQRPVMKAMPVGYIPPEFSR